MISIEELVTRKVEEVKNALNRGCRVFLGNMPVESIDIIKRPRTVIVVVNGETAMYPYDFLRRRLSITCGSQA